MASDSKPFKCVVFSSWSKVLDIVSQALHEANIGVEDFSKAARESAVASFRDDAAKHVLLVSMRGTSNSGAAGLTLTMARYIRRAHLD